MNCAQRTEVREKIGKHGAAERRRINKLFFYCGALWVII